MQNPVIEVSYITACMVTTSSRGVKRFLPSLAMASEQAELTTNPTDVATALSEDGGKNEKTAVSGESGDERTSLHELDDSWSWPAYTSSLASDYSLKVNR